MKTKRVVDWFAKGFTDAMMGFNPHPLLINNRDYWYGYEIGRRRLEEMSKEMLAAA